MRLALLKLLYLAVLLSGSCWIVVGGQTCTSSVLDSSVTYITSAVPHDVGSPGVRIAWNTTIPPQCIQLIKVNNETDVLYTTINAIQMEAILSDLHCDRRYNIHITIEGKYDDGHYKAWSRSVPVHVGVPPSPVSMTATPAAHTTNVDLSWGWSSGLTQCLGSVWIEYHEDGSIENLMSLQLNSTSVTSATLQNLKSSSIYIITITTIGMNQTRLTEQTILLPPREYPTNTTDPTYAPEDPTDDQQNSSTDYINSEATDPTYAPENSTDDWNNSLMNYTVSSEATDPTYAPENSSDDQHNSSTDYTVNSEATDHTMSYAPEDSTDDWHNSSTDYTVNSQATEPTYAPENSSDDWHNPLMDFTVNLEATTMCTYAGAVIGAAIASVVILLIVVIAEFAIIQHLRRSITKRKKQLQRSITNMNTEPQRVTEISLEEYSEGSAEWNEAHIYEAIP